MFNLRSKIILTILVIVSSLGFGQAPLADAKPNQTARLETSIIETKQLDPRAEILANYFKKYNSPLQYQAQDFIDAADEFKVDWKLVPAIAGVESGFGKHIPGGYGQGTISYNAWGWGVYGTQSLAFNSWRNGIFTVAGGLKKGYIDKGLTDPYAMNRIYASSPTWGVRVDHFLNDISKFASSYTLTEEKTASARVNALSKTAGASAQLAFKP